MTEFDPSPFINLLKNLSYIQFEVSHFVSNNFLGLYQEEFGNKIAFLGHYISTLWPFPCISAAILFFAFYALSPSCILCPMI